MAKRACLRHNRAAMGFRFVALDLAEVCIPFRLRFKHALAERAAAECLIVSLHTEAGETGYGQVLPRAYLTGETLASAWDTIANEYWPRLKALTFDDRIPAAESHSAAAEPGLAAGSPAPVFPLKPGTTRDFFQTLRPLYEEADAARQTAAWAGLDIAATDAWARLTRRSGCSLFGQHYTRGYQFLTAVIGGGSENSARWQARLFKWLGFREFKVKVGQDNDEQRLRAVRAVLGPRRRLRADANAAWSEAEAIEKCGILKQFAIESIEQPIAAGDAAALARVQARGGLPVMADESLCTRADADELAAHNAAMLWNIRLAKVGGYSGLLALLERAERAGAQPVSGVLVGETSVLAAAQRACAGLVTWTHMEYGFPRILLKTDLFRGGPAGYFGVAQPLPDTPGLGVRLLPDALDAICVRRERFE